MITQTDIVSQPIGEGDVGVVIGKDGSAKVFSTHDLTNGMPDGVEAQMRMLKVFMLIIGDKDLQEKLLQLVDAVDQNGHEWFKATSLN